MKPMVIAAQWGEYNALYLFLPILREGVRPASGTQLVADWQKVRPT